MSSDDPESTGPPRPKPRPYQPPPGAAKPKAPPAAEKPIPESPQAVVKPTPTMPLGARLAQQAVTQQAVAQQATAGGRPAVGLRGGAFEFTFEQDELLKDLGKNLRTVSWAALAAAGLLLARYGLPLIDSIRQAQWVGAGEAAVAVMLAVVLAVSFVLLRSAGVGFADIVASQGQDVPLLIQALRGLNRLFSSLSLVAIVLGGLIVLGVAGSVIRGAGKGDSKAKPPANAAASPEPTSKS